MHLCPAFVILKNSYKIQYVKKKKNYATRFCFLFAKCRSIEVESCADLSTWKQPLVSARTRYLFVASTFNAIKYVSRILILHVYRSRFISHTLRYFLK